MLVAQSFQRDSGSVAVMEETEKKQCEGGIHLSLMVRADPPALRMGHLYHHERTCLIPSRVLRMYVSLLPSGDSILSQPPSSKMRLWQQSMICRDGPCNRNITAKDVEVFRRNPEKSRILSGTRMVAQ
jgi:hypothetical protein